MSAATGRHVTSGGIIIFDIMSTSGIAISGVAEIPGRRVRGGAIVILFRIGLPVGGVIPVGDVLPVKCAIVSASRIIDIGDIIPVSIAITIARRRGTNDKPTGGQPFQKIGIIESETSEKRFLQRLHA